MKILYLITRSEPGGAQVHVLDLIKGFRDRADIVLGVGDEGYLSEEARSLGTTVLFVPNLVQPLNPVKDRRALTEIRSLLRGVKPDLVHAHSSKAGILGRLAAIREKVPAVFTAHGWAFAEGVPWRRKVLALASERLAGRWSDRIITVSEQDRNLAIQYRVAGENDLIAIHNGIPDVPWRAEPDGTGRPIVIMVARFAAQKDQGLLIRAMEDVDQPCSIQFVGDGPTRREIEGRVAVSPIEDRIEFLGNRNDVPELLAQAHIFVLTSNWEGFPISILEAMRAGLPVVASDVGGVREAVVDGETGYLVPKGDVHTLRERLRRLMVDPSLRLRMGRAGRRRYETYFTLDRMLNRTWEVYEAVLRQRGS